jgi:hypothetical protein
MKKNLITLIGASALALSGCSSMNSKVSNSYDFTRDVFEITNKGGYVSETVNNPKQVLNDLYNPNLIVNMFEEENDCFQERYGNLPLFEENKLENYARFLSNIPKDQINALVSTYNTCLVENDRRLKQEEFIYKRITSGAIAAFIAAGLSGAGGNSISNSGTPTTPNYTIGNGGSTNIIGNITK